MFLLFLLFLLQRLLFELLSTMRPYRVPTLRGRHYKRQPLLGLRVHLSGA